jgi:hypothetical protein
MSDVAYINEAADLSKRLTRMRARGPGEIENAMRALERDYGIEYSFLWSLRYRRDQLKFISASFFARIKAAYAAECARQMRSLAHEYEVTKAQTGIADDFMDSVAALVAETDAEETQ